MSFEHQALDLTDNKKFVFTAMSKHFFYFRMHISKFVFDQNYIPLNPFMIFDYFLLDTVDRDVIRNANNNVMKKADELWIFGDISNGVLAEIKMAKEWNMPVRYFKIHEHTTILPIEIKDIVMEEEVREFRNELSV